MSKESPFILTSLDLNKSENYLDDPSRVAKAAQLAGAIYSSDDDLKNSVGGLVSADVEAYRFSADGESKVEGNLKSIVLIDKKNKSVTIVTAGTRMDTTYEDMLSDLSDDFKLSIGIQPTKKVATQGMNDLILAKLGEEQGQYNFHYVGHSLGAVVSDIAATNMAIKLAKRDIPVEGKISTTTFDNPGSYTLVHKMLKKYKDNLTTQENTKYERAKSSLEGDKLKEAKNEHKNAKKAIKDLKLNDFVDYKSFNNRENFINTNDKQAGKHYTIAPKDQKERGAFSRMMGWLAEKMPGVVVKKLFKLLSYGSLVEQAKEHSTENFIAVLKEENGKILYHDEDKKVEVSILDFAHQTKPLEYNETIFESLEKKALYDIRPMRDYVEDVKPEFSMCKDGKRVEFSREELVGCLSEENAKNIPQEVIKDLAMHLKMDKGYVARPEKNKGGSIVRSK